MDELNATSQINNVADTMPGSWSIPPTLLISGATLAPSTALPLRLEMQPGTSAAFPSSLAAASSVSPFESDDSIPVLSVGGTASGTPTLVIDMVKMATLTSSPSSSSITTITSSEAAAASPIEDDIRTRTSISTITSTGVSMGTSCAPTVISCPPVFAYFTATFATTLLYCGFGDDDLNDTICASSPSSTAVGAGAASSSYLQAGPTTAGFTLSTSYTATATAASLTPVPSPPENDMAVETVTIAGGGDEDCGRAVRKRAVMMVW